MKWTSSVSTRIDAREGEVSVRARSRESERSRSVVSSDGDEPGRRWHEILAESQTEVPQEFDGEELRERDDVPSRPWRSRRRIRRGFNRRSTWMLTRMCGISWNRKDEPWKDVRTRVMSVKATGSTFVRDTTLELAGVDGFCTYSDIGQGGPDWKPKARTRQILITV